ncbi:hypothetical protein [Nocardioides pyridinolyticus]
MRDPGVPGHDEPGVRLPAERKMDPAIVAGLVRTAVTLPPEVVLQSLVVTLRNEQ